MSTNLQEAKAVLAVEAGPVTSSANWWEKRRPEIFEYFDSEVYGRLPENIPQVRWNVISVKDTSIGNFPVKEKTLSGIVDNSSFPGITVEIEMIVATPVGADKPVPTVLEFGFSAGLSVPRQLNPMVSCFHGMSPPGKNS